MHTPFKVITNFLFVYLIFLTPVFAADFTLTSADFSGQISHAQVFNSFGCNGGNISPTISWRDAPKGTKSFAVTLYDPDAPTGSGWWHWIIFDLPADSTELKQNAGNVKMELAPKGSIQSMTSFAQRGFGGPCPPVGDRPHQYLLTVYALSSPKLGLDASALPELVGFYIHQNLLAKASIVAYYAR